MVEAFNLIEFFGVAALLGWFTFSVAIEDLLRRFKRKRGMREKLIRINDYFAISFGFYAIAGMADYFFWHETVFGRQYDFAALTVVAFACGTLVLTWPVLYLQLLQRRATIFVQKMNYALVLCVATVANIMLLVLMLPDSPVARTTVIFTSLPTVLGLLFAMSEERIGAAIGLLAVFAVLSWIVLGVFSVLGWTSFRFL